MIVQPPAGRRSLTRWVAVALALALSIGLSACSSHNSTGPSPHTTQSTSEPPLGFRSQPSFLPSTESPVDQVVTATPTKPQLAEQGVAVEVTIPAGHALVTVTGPQVPPFVAPPPPAVTATWDVTLTGVVGTIPINLSDFSVTDQLGRSFHPTFVENAATPPGTAAPGATTTFQVTAVMPTGEGRIYWSPTHTTPIVGWDFIVEND